MKLARRLRAVLNQINTDSIVDIGTDHAYIPIAGVLEKKIKRAIASDLRIGPLEIAKKNIIAHGLEDKIKIRLSNGFENILAGEADTAIISGMGGLVICEIISRAQKILTTFKQLIIQPQNNIYQARKIIHDSGFKITNEIILYQRNFYNIIVAHTGKDSFYTERDLILGKILLEKKDLILKKFLLYKTKKLSEIRNFNNKANELYKIYTEALDECFAKK